MRTPAEERARNQYLRNLHIQIVDEVFDVYNRERQDKLYRLIQENTNLLRNDGITANHSFMYAGEFYSFAYYTPKNECNRLIHSSMMKPIAEFMGKKDFNLIEQRQKIGNYIINVLLFAKHVYDIQELIPDKFRIHHNPDPSIFDTGPPATEEELEQFRTRNISGLLEFKRMFLEELLMA